VKVSGILETALYVADPAVSAGYYNRLFGFETLLDTDRLVALNVAGRDVLLLFKKGATEEPATLPGGVIPGHGASGRSHLAFSITAEDIEPWRERLAGEGVAIESTVSWPGGALP
jgi:catechol 2,3-dioxygenase-like lactoylglutathione lyase family enzyme